MLSLTLEREGILKTNDPIPQSFPPPSAVNGFFQPRELFPSRSGTRGQALRHFRCPSMLTCQITGPVRTAVGDVFTVGNEALVQLAGEQGHAIGPGMVAKPVTSETNLGAARDQQHLLI